MSWLSPSIKQSSEEQNLGWVENIHKKKGFPIFTILHAKCRRTFVQLYYVMNKRPLGLFPQEDESVMTRGWFVGNNGSPSNADYARPPPTWILYHKTAPHFIIKPQTNLWSCIFLCLHRPVILFVHFDITASHLLGNGFARRHFDVWFELAKNIALRLWRYEMQNLPQIQDQRVGKHQDLIDCWASANPRGCFNDLGFIHTAAVTEK